MDSIIKLEATGRAQIVKQDDIDAKMNLEMLAIIYSPHINCFYGKKYWLSVGPAGHTSGWVTNYL